MIQWQLQLEVALPAEVDREWELQMTDSTLVIDVMTPLGFRVVCTEEYWQRIVSIKHPALKDRKEDVKTTLSEPNEIRRSMGDPEVLLFHRRDRSRWLCAVVKCGQEAGYLITAYPADKVTLGEPVWIK